MLVINENQRDNIIDTVNKMNTNIENMIKEVENTERIMDEFCEKEKIDTYYTWTICEQLNEAKIRLQMAQTRIEEFKGEANSLKLSTSGFY